MKEIHSRSKARQEKAPGFEMWLTDTASIGEDRRPARAARTCGRDNNRRVFRFPLGLSRAPKRCAPNRYRPHCIPTHSERHGAANTAQIQLAYPETSLTVV